MIIEPDQHYYDGGRYVWSEERRDAVWERCYRLLEETLAAGGVRKVVVLVGIPGCGKSHYARQHDAEDVILFDGLFVDPARRRRVVEIGRAAGMPVEAVWLQGPWERCAVQNAGRTPDRRVPAEIMELLWRQLEEHPPSTAEGFAAVHRV